MNYRFKMNILYGLSFVKYILILININNELLITNDIYMEKIFVFAPTHLT